MDTIHKSLARKKKPSAPSDDARIIRFTDEETKLLVIELLDKLQAKGRSIPEQIRLIDAENEPRLPEKPNLPENLLNCTICLDAYSKQIRLPLVGSCGHTICRRCVQSLENHNCPICRAIGSFRRSSQNFLACDLLDQLNKFPSDNEIEEEGPVEIKAKEVKTNAQSANAESIDDDRENSDDPRRIQEERRELLRQLRLNFSTRRNLRDFQEEQTRLLERLRQTHMNFAARLAQFSEYYNNRP